MEKLSNAAALTPGATSYRGPGSCSRSSGKNDSIHVRDKTMRKRVLVMARHTEHCLHMMMPKSDGQGCAQYGHSMNGVPSRES
eukprot:2277050-Pleurochrysis_carterae.AAC.1